MDPRSGAIAAFERNEDARQAGYTIKLSPHEAGMLADVPREARLDHLAAARQERNRRKKAHQKRRK